MRSYKHSNGRVTARSSNGRFKKTTFSDVFGVQPNIDRLICGKCGHGKKGDFIPLLATGHCPECDNQEGHITLSEYAQGLIGLKFWYVADLWETLCAVPVTVKSVTIMGAKKGKTTLLWQIDEEYTEEYEITDLTQLYETEKEAERAISERRAAADNE